MLKSRVEKSGFSKNMSVKKIVVYSVFLTVLIIFTSFIQALGVTLFGAIPAVTLAAVCAIGFILGERFGAIFGIFSGIILDYVSSEGISFTPILYMLCGYLCGAAVGWFLSKNFPSFLVYGAIAGVIREIFTLTYIGLFSRNFAFSDIILKILIPEYFAYIVCIIPAYFAVLGIYLLFKGKDSRSRSGY